MSIKPNRWLHTANELLKQCRDSLAHVSHPSKLTGWVDDMKLWPENNYIDLVNYFILTEGVGE